MMQVTPRKYSTIIPTSKKSILDIIGSLETRIVCSSNPYEVLGISEDATLEQIKQARNAIMRDIHPDTNPEFTDFYNGLAVKVNDAYEKLKN